MRARNVKPAFFKNEQLAQCSFAARLLFIGLWCLADREGRLQDRPARIKMEVFPGDEVDCSALLDELEGQDLVRRYEAGGLRCIHIPRFFAHQKPHANETASQLPPPPQRSGVRAVRIMVVSASHHGRKSFGPWEQGLSPSPDPACPPSDTQSEQNAQSSPSQDRSGLHGGGAAGSGAGEGALDNPECREDQGASDHGGKPFEPRSQALGPECGMRNEECGSLNEEWGTPPSGEGGSPSASPDGSSSASRKEGGAPAQCPHEEIISLYHEVLPELPRVRVWKEASRRNLRARWRESSERRSLAWWRWFFRECIRQSDFLMGRKTDFVATLSWMVQPKNFEKILNGQYANFGPATGSRLGDKNAMACSLFVNSDAQEESDGK